MKRKYSMAAKAEAACLVSKMNHHLYEVRPRTDKRGF